MTARETDWMLRNYHSDPPQLCLHNGTTCNQGRVPLYAVNASSAADIQAGVRFAAQHDLRVSVKSSGHDYLGRSTAADSLLLWTRYLQGISFTDHFVVNGRDLGSAVTVGSGVSMHTIYQLAAEHDKVVVGGRSATVAAGGGYGQGGGHSPFSPFLGLAADNALQYEVVLASGDVVMANEASHPDLFWALRGGGAGTWGVILSFTMRTFPSFPATLHTSTLLLNSSTQIAAVMTAYARHIFDLDASRASQTVILVPEGPGVFFLQLETFFPNATSADSAATEPFLDDALALGANVTGKTTQTEAKANDLVFMVDDPTIIYIETSRLVPAAAYRDTPEAIGTAHKTLLDLGFPIIAEVIVGGGKIAENAVIDNAVNPKWRTMKTHSGRPGPTRSPPATIQALRHNLTTQATPLLTSITGEADPGAYSNEADVREVDPAVTFFGGGAHYARLSAIKRKYDPRDLFIVRTGVGSERWDVEGMCTLV
ncbi:FAD-binding domain-containing protein [Mycena venus]|uniref:FAD-binding domain-containing protein n=1 Tax=Mycena venus TaxID=2733690 RepID=A0A8H7DE35_9AGAR|nr:FAD-binding domain-containing protein [Mycena venus]